MTEIRAKAEADRIPEIKQKWTLEKSDKVLARKLSKELQDAVLSTQSSLSKEINKLDFFMFQQFMEAFGYYSTDTQLKGTLDTKLLLKQAHIDTLIKEAYFLIKGES